MFINKIRVTCGVALTFTALSLSGPASAAYVLQTASAGTNGSSGVYSAYGDGTDAGSNFIGATFTLGSSTGALQVGGNFDNNGVGSVFAEVVAVPSLSSLPSVTGAGPNALVTWLQANSLGQALLTAPTSSGDASTTITFGGSGLAAGNYALIFGSGLFGTTGGSVFGSPIPGQVNFTDTSNGNVTIGSPNLFSSTGGDTFAAYGYDTGIRTFASPVPLPAGLPLLISGLGAGAAFLRRRQVPRAG